MDSTGVVVILAAIAASALFSGIEIAFLSANRLKIELDNQKGLLSGKILSRYVKKDSHFIASMLLGNNIALVVYGIWMAKLLEPLISPLVNDSSILVLLIQTILSTLLIVVTAEFLPKATFQINPNRVLQLLSVPIVIVYNLLYPFTVLTMFLSNGVLKLFGVSTKSVVTAFSKVDFDDYVRDLNDRMEDENELDNEMQILQNALVFPELKARDCMIPRTDILAVDLETPIHELREKFIESGLTKILIYRDSIDNIIGYTHSFEMFKKPKSIKEILIPISFVPEAILAKDLLEIFSKQHGNIAVVVDEFGGTSGLITLEDVLEEIFGDIEDEHDKEGLLEEQVDANTFLFSARQDVDYLNETYDLELEESSEYETIGGLVLHHLESIPEEGTVLEIDKYEICIESVTDRRIEVVRLTVTED